MKRISFVENNDKKEFVISSTKNWFFIIAFAPFLLVWLAVELFIPILILANLNAISSLGIWFLGWTVIGVFIVKTWIWEVFGKTILSIKNSKLIIKKKFDFISSSKYINLIGITDLMILNKDIESTRYFTRPNYLFSTNTKSINFNYGSSKINAVNWINQEEAELIIKILSESIEVARSHKNQSS
jgi:hypothetical protein